MNLPALRFTAPDGTPFPKWQTKKLGEIGEFRGGGTPDTSKEEYWNGDIPWVSSSDIFDGNIHKISISRYITEDAVLASATKIIPPNSILLVSRVGVGKFAVTEQRLSTSQDFSNFTPYNAKILYISYLLLHNKHILINLSQGTSILGFTLNDIKTIPIPLPSLPEQEKIANALTAVDDKITALKDKTAHYEAFKKGLMQQLFPQSKSATSRLSS